MIVKVGDIVTYNGFIPDDIPSFKKEDLSCLIPEKLYTILQLSPDYGEMDDHYIWYRIEEGEFRLWYPDVSFDRIDNIDMKKKYDLR